MQIGRNVIVMATADVIIAVDGGAGTLSELAIGWQLGKPMIAIGSTGGWSARLAGVSIDHRGAAPVHAADDADAALERAAAELARPRPEPGEIGSGWRVRAETTG